MTMLRYDIDRQDGTRWLPVARSVYGYREVRRIIDAMRADHPGCHYRVTVCQ
jgi:hypothetical protein